MFKEIIRYILNDSRKRITIKQYKCLVYLQIKRYTFKAKSYKIPTFLIVSPLGGWLFPLSKRITSSKNNRKNDQDNSSPNPF